MEIYPELNAFLADDLDIDVVQAAGVPDCVRVQAAFLFECIDIPELDREPDYWFWALQAITGEDPVPPAHRGDLSKMAAAWIRWGKQQGYRW